MLYKCIAFMDHSQNTYVQNDAENDSLQYCLLAIITEKDILIVVRLTGSTGPYGVL